MADKGKSQRCLNTNQKKATVIHILPYFNGGKNDKLTSRKLRRTSISSSTLAFFVGSESYTVSKSSKGEAEMSSWKVENVTTKEEVQKSEEDRSHWL